ncbi:alpha/beta hydrolase family protein [Lyngbya aestuarii BL J]|uniref:Alpha/beta hydrolase family protein n=2 Tax=Lyngbya aestuarii BL J TaxID=1348334 RepID=U7QD73_9CYAN|nr:alpha/beta hydrolase [Lyngbya aestuarii]ERT05793.1 alpha/beta hydrolase family protein [Lyngbya aestuarii BL J]
MKNIFKKYRWLALGALSFILNSFPVAAAERIYIDYGSMETSVSVTTLESYAKDNKTEPELSPYLNLLTVEQQEQFRQLLKMQLTFDSQQVQQVFKAKMGELLFETIGEMIQVKEDENGAVALQNAVLKAAANPEGLTLLNIIRQFPGEIQLDILKIQELFDNFSSLRQETLSLVKTLEIKTQAEAQQEPETDFSQLADIRTTGQYKVSRETFTLQDAQRNREFNVNLYFPTQLQGEPESIPIIVISPGLGATSETWLHLVKHLVSHGYFVATVHHPGSNFSHLQAFFEGRETDVFDVQEFINRPLDITQVLNELEDRNLSQFQGKLNLKKVGIAGQSFGAYTALALAGAKINFEQLKQDCRSPIELLNLSRLLQCQALTLPQQNYNLKDDRIQAIFLVDPVSSSVFGQASLSEVNLPIFWGSGSNDRLTPVILEQLHSFTWLSSKNKYFALTKGSQHLNLNFSALQKLRSLEEEALPELVSQNLPVVESYVNALSLAFFQVYVANQPNYQPYLRSSYAMMISQEPHTLSFLSSSTSHQLTDILTQIIGSTNK